MGTYLVKQKLEGWRILEVEANDADEAARLAKSGCGGFIDAEQSYGEMTVLGKLTEHLN